MEWKYRFTMYKTITMRAFSSSAPTTGMPKERGEMGISDLEEALGGDLEEEEVEGACWEV